MIEMKVAPIPDRGSRQSCFSIIPFPAAVSDPAVLLSAPPLIGWALPSSSSSSLSCSRAVCHQRRLLRRRDGAPDADADAGGVHAVCRGLLQRLRALHGRRHQEGEAARRGQQRRGRQAERREPLRQGRFTAARGRGLRGGDFESLRKSSQLPGISLIHSRFIDLSIHRECIVLHHVTSGPWHLPLMSPTKTSSRLPNKEKV